MADASAAIRLQVIVENQQSVKKALNGTVSEVKKAQTDIRKEQDKSYKELYKLTERSVRIQEKAARASAEAVRKAEQQKRVEVAKTARETERTLATSLRNAAKLTKDFISRNRAILGGVAAGGAFAVSQARGLVGTPSTQEGVGGFLEFRRELIRLKGELGLTSEASADLQKNIVKASGASLQTSNDLLKGITQAQNLFERTDFVIDNLTFLGKVASATGSTFEEVVNAAGSLVENFKLNSKDVPAAFGLLKEANINLSNPKTAAAVALFQEGTGATGLGGVGSFAQASKIIGKGAAGNAKLSNARINALSAFLNSEEGVKTLSQGTGQKLTQGNIDLAQVVEGLAGNKNINAADIQNVIGGPAGAAFATLVDEARNNGNKSGLRTVGGGAVGIGEINTSVAEQQRDITGKVVRSQIDINNKYLDTSEALLEKNLALAKVTGELEASFPLATQAVKTFAVALGTSSLLQILGKAGGVGAGGNVAAGGIGGAAGLIGKAGGVLAAGGLGYAAGTVINELPTAFGGKNISDYINGGSNSDPSTRALQHKNVKAIDESTIATRELTAAVNRSYRGGVDPGVTR